MIVISDANIIEVKENLVILDKDLEDGEYSYFINEKRREDIRQQHTAQHIFSAEAYNNFGLNTVGFRMAEEYTTVDLDQKDISKEDISKELNIMGLKRDNPNFDDYVSLVERTRYELKTLIVKEGNNAIKQYLN